MANYTKPGRPRNLALNAEVNEIKEETPVSKIGKFIVVNTAQVQGQRYNLEKVRTYGKSETDVVSLVWDNGLTTQLKFPSRTEADELIERIDSYCL